MQLTPDIMQFLGGLSPQHLRAIVPFLGGALPPPQVVPDDSGTGQMAPGSLHRGSMPAGSSFWHSRNPEAFAQWMKLNPSIPASHRAGEQVSGAYMLDPYDAWVLKNTGMQSTGFHPNF